MVQDQTETIANRVVAMRTYTDVVIGDGGGGEKGGTKQTRAELSGFDFQSPRVIIHNRRRLIL